MLLEQHLDLILHKEKYNLAKYFLFCDDLADISVSTSHKESSLTKKAAIRSYLLPHYYDRAESTCLVKICSQVINKIDKFLF